MLVFKFGGASVKNADAVRNVSEILRKYEGENLVVVVSAMGKTTNALEEIHRLRFEGRDCRDKLRDVSEFHDEIISELLGDDPTDEIDRLINEMEATVDSPPGSDYDLEYDRVVSFGEFLSTRIVEAFLRKDGHKTEWFDVRNVIKTDGNHRAASIDWTRSELSAQVVNAHLDQEGVDTLVTQGFVGSSKLNNTTTLGREGSDFSGAILANILDADKLIIWKDVPGMLNADPKWFNHVEKLSQISYREAVELSYYGASVIHPKTIKPLQNKSIPLYVKSFEEPGAEGSLIFKDATYDKLIPSYIFRSNQTLVSISPKDFSFIVEAHLSEIFEVCSVINLRMNLMQNSALNFSMVIDHDPQKLDKLTDLLSEAFTIKYNEGLKLLTIRHYDQKIVDQLTKDHEVLLEQKSRQTMRVAMRNK